MITTPVNSDLEGRLRYLKIKAEMRERSYVSDRTIKDKNMSTSPLKFEIRRQQQQCFKIVQNRPPQIAFSAAPWNIKRKSNTQKMFRGKQEQTITRQALLQVYDASWQNMVLQMSYIMWCIAKEGTRHMPEKRNSPKSSIPKHYIFAADNTKESETPQVLVQTFRSWIAGKGAYVYAGGILDGGSQWKFVREDNSRRFEVRVIGDVNIKIYISALIQPRM